VDACSARKLNHQQQGYTWWRIHQRNILAVFMLDFNQRHNAHGGSMDRYSGAFYPSVPRTLHTFSAHDQRIHYHCRMLGRVKVKVQDTQCGTWRLNQVWHCFRACAALSLPCLPFPLRRWDGACGGLWTLLAVLRRSEWRCNTLQRSTLR
jgi:hypothetical protein